MRRSLRFRLYRMSMTIGCHLGFHDLSAWEAHDDIAVPIDPRGRPGPNSHRKCEWCGARWESGYDPPSGPTWVKKGSVRAVKGETL